MVCNPVRREPIVKEAGDDEQGALVADLAIHRVWQPRHKDLDIRFVDTDTLSKLSVEVLGHCRWSLITHSLQ